MALSANGLMAHAVREAVDSVAAPDRREAVISLALRWSKLSEIPEAGPDVADFIENSLHRAAEEVLGTESANMIVEQLRPIAEMVGAEEVSEIRRSYPELAAFTEEPDDRPISKVSLSTRPPALDLEFELDGDDGADFELGFDFEEPADDDDPVIIVLDEDGNEEEEESVLQTGRVAVTHRPAARNTLAPFVLVSSADPTRLSSINSALGSAATVEVVSDALAVLQGLTDDRARLLSSTARGPRCGSRRSSR